LSLLIFVGFSIVAEGLFFLLYDKSDSVNMTNTSRRWFRRHVHENNLGYRDVQDFAMWPRPGVYRIGFLGDSLTFGHGIANVADRFGDRVRSQLIAAAPGKFQVYNLGVCGTDTPQHIRQLQIFAQNSFRFHMIVLVYNPNDICALMPDNQEMFNRYWELEPKTWLLRHTYLPNFLYCRAVQQAVSQTKDYDERVVRAFEDSAWSQHQTQLEQIIDHCREMDIELRVVLFPLVQYMGGEYPLRAAHEKLDAFWIEHGVPHLDLLPLLDGRPRHELVVNPFDGHPSHLVHRIAGEAIYERLLAREPMIQSILTGDESQ
jgi:hypothetical protein